MRCCAVIPSEDWRGSAGARIRYDRLRAPLAALGVTLEMQPVDAFAGKSVPEAEVYWFTKCHDRRAPLLAAALKARGARVGVDVFDDYYSDARDARFVQQRGWFRRMAAAADFLLCATPAMAERLARLAPELPCHVINDPAEPLPAALAAGLAARAEAALRDRHLAMAWFGIGDNPSFPVGLEDLHGFGAALAPLRRAGWTVSLEVLTNRRALTLDRLEMLGRLPVVPLVDEWSAAREAALLERALVAFLPVNAQRFSVVKSLNRALTALTAGAQVLSAGFPLYDRLAEFVYRDPAALLADLQAGRLKLRPETVPDLGRAVAAAGDPAAEAAGLRGFLSGPAAPRRDAAPAPPLAAVLHGPNTLGPVHRVAQRLGALSVAGPSTRAALNFDVAPVWRGDGTLELRLSAAAARRLRPDQAGRARSETAADGRTVTVLELPAPPGWPPPVPGGPVFRGRELARGPRDLALMAGLLEGLFGPVDLQWSEARLPLADGGAGQGAAHG